MTPFATIFQHIFKKYKASVEIAEIVLNNLQLCCSLLKVS